MSLVPGRYVGINTENKQYFDRKQMRSEILQIETRVEEIYQASKDDNLYHVRLNN